MNYITVKLTEDQAQRIMIVFGDPNWVQNGDYPKKDPSNAFAQRISTKMFRALQKHYLKLETQQERKVRTLRGKISNIS